MNHTGRKIEEVEAALDRDTFMTAEQAKEWGLVDKIVDRREEDAATDRVVIARRRRTCALCARPELCWRQ